MNNIWQKKRKQPLVALAPMAGYTDAAFRLVCQKKGADIVYTEMVAVEAIWRKNEKTLKMLETLEGEKNVILQLFGSQPDSFVKAIQIMQEIGTFKNKAICGIDINLGCPAKKVFKTGAGAALMNNKEIAHEIIQKTIEVSPLPVSIKIRSAAAGVSAVEFIKYIEDLNVAAVMIHGRTLAQGFGGEVDFEMIKRVKKILPNIPVLANGGIKSASDAKKMLDKTEADGVGIARGAWGNPWIFKQIKSELSSPRKQGSRETQNKIPVCAGMTNISWKEIKKTMLEHAKYFIQYKDDLVELRKQMLFYIKGLPNAIEMRKKIIEVKSLNELKKILK